MVDLEEKLEDMEDREKVVEAALVATATLIHVATVTLVGVMDQTAEMAACLILYSTMAIRERMEVWRSMWPCGMARVWVMRIDTALS